MQIAALLTTLASLATTVSAAQQTSTVYTQDNTILWDGQGYTPCTSPEDREDANGDGVPIGVYGAAHNAAG
ncbi:hypothetical protein HYALB_00010166 [Hymenoscyphus albidus]|uniref:Uncharacterized protein n=1 Tax=Hymenoscyphus albidus TaxID=595503 RepID=A0A9N9QCD2_9HELO|nr:hypothetical protein HYALB_00010166 [Hymenoscyphus albidus]